MLGPIVKSGLYVCSTQYLSLVSSYATPRGMASHALRSSPDLNVGSRRLRGLANCHSLSFVSTDMLR